MESNPRDGMNSPSRLHHDLSLMSSLRHLNCDERSPQPRSQLRTTVLRARIALLRLPVVVVLAVVVVNSHVASSEEWGGALGPTTAGPPVVVVLLVVVELGFAPSLRPCAVLIERLVEA